MILWPMMAMADAVEIDGIYYNLITKGKIAEVTSNPNKYSGSVAIPEKINCEGVEYDVTSIGNYAFNGCSGLSSITIPNSVTSIGETAFYSCTGLTSVVIGGGVKTIRRQAFSNCPELTDVTCYAENVPTTQSDAFADSHIEYATLHVPDASVNAYGQAEPWKNFKEIVGLSGTATQKCATPTIKIVGGGVTFECETDGVTFKWNYKFNAGNNEGDGDNAILAGKTNCHVTVYATKDGYLDSDVAEADVELYVGLKGDVNADGEVNVGDIVTTTNIMAGKDE